MALTLVAECGLNANGDIELLKLMIDAAHEAGFDAIKLQKRTVHVVYSKEFLDGPRESRWGDTQRHQKMGLEFSLSDYIDIDRYCRKLGIEWFASAWDIESQHFLDQFNLKYNKVASPMLGNMPLLRLIASEGRKTFISTGMCTLMELDDVVAIFKNADCPFELMHCNSTYPMKDEDANLRCIPMLRERYNCDVGYSGHETSVTKVCVAAVALGATSIERHITLDKTMYGSDQAASIECHDLKNFAAVVRAVPLMLGDGVKSITESEWPIRNKLRVEVA